MKIGFLTVPLNGMDVKEIIHWAAESGFEAIEVAAWPVENERDFSATTVNVDEITSRDIQEIRDTLTEYGILISSLAYYDNNLDANLDKRKKINNHLIKVIDLAHNLGVELVGTFIGRDITKTVEENIVEFEKVFKPIIAYAESRNVKLMIENCPMMGWQEEEKIGNIFYSPELWREIFRITPDSFGINFDPSHLYWLGIDIFDAIKEFAPRIFHAHAKDVEIDVNTLYDQSILGHFGTNGHGKSWWTYRLPGFGTIDWRRFIRELQKVGYDYVLSIEHEDPIWSGSIEKSQKGLLIGLKNLKNAL
ncbi:MAG: sugar phosphate isomerase/epimerase [Fervidobacterium sp.]|nr:sugar phosphate isomerase/epimerase [Fervidobacterium sp.]